MRRVMLIVLAVVVLAASSPAFAQRTSRVRSLMQKRVPAVPHVPIQRFDDADPRLVYSSAWVRVGEPSAVRHDFSSAGEPGSADMLFRGTSVCWLAVTGPGCGVARVWLDGLPAGTVNLYAPRVSSCPVWVATGLAPGRQHHLRIEWTGFRSMSSTGTSVTVDAFDIRGTLERDVAPPVTSDDVAAHDPYTDVAAITLSARDDGLGVACTEYSVDGSERTRGTSFVIAELGTHTLSYRSTDLAGNVEETRTVAVHVRSSDVTSPVTSCDATPGPYLDRAVIHLSAADAGLGVAATSYRVDGGEWMLPSGHTNAGSIVVTIDGPGEHTLDYRSTDLAGNIEETRTATVPVAHRYAWDDPAVHYEGGWMSWGAEDFLVAETAATATVAFTGTDVYIRPVDFAGFGMGMAAVSVDGGAPALVDFSERPAMWSPGRLASGHHVVRISWTGVPGACSAGGTFIGLEALDVVGRLEPQAPPQVRWDAALTPADGAVIYSDPGDPSVTRVLGDGTGRVSLVASASVTGEWPPLTSARFTVDGSAGPVVLQQWALSATRFSNDGSLPGFDPFALALPFSEDLGLPFIPDGRRTFRVRVADGIGTSSEDVRTFVVDNHPPEGFSPGSAVYVGPALANRAKYDGGFQMSWTPPYDGTDPVADYRVNVWQGDGAAIELPAHTLGAAGSVCVTSGLDPLLTVSPFSAYQVQLVPVSARFEGTPSPTSALVLTTPRLTGSVFNAAPTKKSLPDYRFSLAISEPSSATMAAIEASYTVYLFDAVDASTYTYPGSGDLPAGTTFYTDTSPVLSQDLGSRCGYYWQVQASVFTADGGMVRRFRSNVVGPVSTAPASLETLPLPIP